MIVFPIMLKGLAQSHYYSSNLSNGTFENACNHIRNYFEGPEFYRKNLTEWNNIDLQQIINENLEQYKIDIELLDIPKEMALQMAFKAINDTTGLDGLVPTLLVFGAYPRIVELDAPSTTVTQRAIAIKKAMVEV